MEENGPSEKCPFCGENYSGYYNTIKNKNIWQECYCCEATGPKCGTAELAHKAWNRRPLEDALLARAEKAEGALRQAHKLIAQGIDMDKLDFWSIVAAKDLIEEAIAGAMEVLDETAMS